MDTIIAHLRQNGRTGLRRIPGQGDVECIILLPESALSPAVAAETYVPVVDFKSRFSTPGALKEGAPAAGYARLIAELEKEGVL